MIRLYDSLTKITERITIENPCMEVEASSIEIVFLSIATLFALLLVLVMYYAVLRLTQFVNDTVDDAGEFLDSIGPRIEAVGQSIEEAFAAASASIITRTDQIKADIGNQLNVWKVKIDTFASNVETTWECAPLYFLQEVDTALSDIETKLDAATIQIGAQLESKDLFVNIVEAVFQSVNDMLGCD
jgi:hypothetical protein